MEEVVSTIFVWLSVIFLFKLHGGVVLSVCTVYYADIFPWINA